MVSEADRKKRREEVFPRDYGKAFDLGAEFALGDAQGIVEGIIGGVQ